MEVYLIIPFIRCDIYRFWVSIIVRERLLHMINALESRLVDYAVSIIKLSANLKNIEASQVLRSQILRSGTSPALNYGEAQNAESKKTLFIK